MPVAPTPRDYQAMSEIGDVGVMSSADVGQRHYNVETTAGLKYFQRRMRDLAAAGLIETTRVTLNTDRGPRKLPNVIRLLPAGGLEVERATGYLPPRPARSDPPTLVTLLHKVGVSRTLLAVRDAACHEELPAVQWILEQDTYPDAKPTARYHEKFVLYESFGVTNGQKLACRPDASFWLQLPGSPAPSLIGYLEYDRSTEGRDQMLAKLPGYRRLLDPQQGRYRKHWPGIQRELARVLIICQSQQRIESLCTWMKDQPGAEYIRLAVESELDNQLLRLPIWRMVSDRPNQPGHRILRSAGPTR